MIVHVVADEVTDTLKAVIFCPNLGGREIRGSVQMRSPVRPQPPREGDGAGEGGREGQVSDWQSVKRTEAQNYEADKQGTSDSKEPVCHQDTQCKNHMGNRLRKETKVVRNSSKAGQIFKKKKKDIEAKELGRPLTPLTEEIWGFYPTTI